MNTKEPPDPSDAVNLNGPKFIEITDSYEKAQFLQMLGLQGPGGMFSLPKSVRVVDIYTKPVSAQWGADRLLKFLTQECNIDLVTGRAFLFFNKKMDRLMLYFKDSDGDQLLTKEVNRGGFMLPVAEPDQDFVQIPAERLPSLFRS